MTGRKAAHDYLQAALPLPPYYGRNLDALYDSLLELPSCTIILRHPAALLWMGRYGAQLRNVFHLAAAERSDLDVTETDAFLP